METQASSDASKRPNDAKQPPAKRRKFTFEGNLEASHAEILALTAKLRNELEGKTIVGSPGQQAIVDEWTCNWDNWYKAEKKP